MKRQILAVLALSIAAAQPTWADPQRGEATAGDYSGGGGPSYSDSNDGARKSVKLNNAAQKAIKSPEPVDNTGFGGGKKHDVSQRAGGDSPNGAGKSNPNSANNGKGPGG